MSIDLLTICEWKERSVKNTEIHDPNWATIEEAIRDLNNNDRNDLYLHPKENDFETYLAVGGGDGRYLVTGSIKNERFPTLVDHQKPDRPKQLLMVGGQEGEYPGNWIVNLNKALETVKSFYEAGEFNEKVDWHYV